ncbi:MULTISPECIES: hypothetical protein [Cupriavidus]
MGNNGQHAQTCSDTDDSGNHDRVAMLTHPFVACLAAIVVAGCTSSVATNTLASRDVPANSASSPSGEPTSAVPHVEFHPGYPPAWVKNFKNLPPEVIPGAKLGYSKEESARRLRPEVRELLDVARRLYYEPDLLARRKSVLALFHVSKVIRNNHRRTLRDGTMDIGFREYFEAGGIFDEAGWKGFYDYHGLLNGDPQKWDASLEIEIDDQKDCLESRAVEGYLDVPIDPRLWPPLVNPVPEERWDRHGIGTGRRLVAVSPVPGAANIGLEFGRGCLASLRFSGRYDLNKVSNEEVLGQ